MSMQMNISLPKKFPRQKAMLLTRDDYAAIAELMKVAIKLRTREYHLDNRGQPFEEYTMSTWVKKRRKDPNFVSPWDEFEEVVQKLVDRLERAATEEEKAPIRRSLGHFRTKIRAIKDFWYKEEREAADVTLTDTGKMLDNMAASGNGARARVDAGGPVARWQSKGVTNDREGKGQLAARPFVGITNAEDDWIMADVVQPFLDFFAEELGRILFKGENPATRPNGRQVVSKALRDMPTKNEEKMAAR